MGVVETWMSLLRSAASKDTFWDWPRRLVKYCGGAGRSVRTSLPVSTSTDPGPTCPLDMPPGAQSPSLTKVAVMKKFQGSRVPRPSMKKTSQTALYLGRRGKKSQVTHHPTPLSDQTQGSLTLLPSFSPASPGHRASVFVSKCMCPPTCMWRGRCPGIGNRVQLCPEEEEEGHKAEGNGHRTVVLSPRRLRGPCRLGNQCDPHIWRWFWKSCSTGWG